MRVDIYDVECDGSETLRGQDGTLNIFDDDDTRHWVDHEIRSRGYCFVGGGAAPLVVLRRPDQGLEHPRGGAGRVRRSERSPVELLTAQVSKPNFS